MSKFVRTIALALGTIGLLLLGATNALAKPDQTMPCNLCHSGPSLTMTTTLVSNTGGTATYNVSATGANAIAVFDGSTKLTTILAASGQFSVSDGKTYAIYAVKGPTNTSGFGSASVSPVAPPSDATAPTTVSDAKATYVSSAAIHLTATDNTGGSGVAHTYYRLDGAKQVEGTTIGVTAIGAHTLEFWSVDVAGNVETHKTVSFSVTAPAPAPDTTPPTTTSDAKATYVSSAAIHLTATDNTGGSGVAHTYYRLDSLAQVEGTAISVTTTGTHSIEFWSVDVAGNVETHKTASFTVTPAATTTATSLTIDSTTYSARKGVPFDLSGVLTPGLVGDSIVVYVKRGSASRWSYSSTRLTYQLTASGGAMWQYRYTAKVKGTYQFYAKFAGTADRLASSSRTIKVTVAR